MCVLLEHPNLMTGWGCCECRSYNGLWRDQCKTCGRRACPVGTAESPDILLPREEEKQ